MARTRVYRYYDDRPPRPAGWFDRDTADTFASVPAEERRSRFGQSTMRKAPQALHRTAGGAWVRETVFDGPAGTRVEYVSEVDASEWLAVNGYVEAAETLFDLPSESGPGRPAIGGLVQVRLGDVADDVDAFARKEHLTRASAVRRLIRMGLAADQP